jgi:hypothetical protein
MDPIKEAMIRCEDREGPLCELCGEPMPEGEPFRYHGFSGPCPKPPLPPATKGLIATDKAKKQKLVDVKCYELATHFLSDDPPGGYFPKSLADERQRTDDLAVHIQQAVEDWFTAFKPAE